MENWMLGTVGITAIIGLWGYIKTIFMRIKRLLILDVEFESGYASIAISGYIKEHFKDSSLNPKKYVAFNLLLKNSSNEVVPMKRLTGGTSIFWNGWIPISVYLSTDKNASSYPPVKMSYIKGTLDIEDLFRKATESYNSISKKVNNSRFYIRYIFGSSGQKTMLSSESINTKTTINKPSNCNDTSCFVENKLLKYTLNDFGNSKTNNSIANIAVPEHAKVIEKDIEKWIDSKQWFLDKGITWKRNYGLYGEPGTGKTSYIRCIAEKYDLPVFVFDLFSLRNEELKEGWNQLLSQTPCIALFEDIDSVFNGRVSSNSELSFDCLLNCLDGVQKNNGIITFITTNNIDKIDPALKNRPGRIDRLIEMTKLNREERKIIVSRILKDFPEQWNSILDFAEMENGAECEKRCIEIANELYWNKK